MAELADLKTELRSLADPAKAAFFPRFFKAGPGEYGEGDQFLGITVPAVRSVAKRHRQLPLSQIEQLLGSRWHEERLTALIILVSQYQRAAPEVKQQLYEFYLQHTDRINNWDLVDSSAANIVGDWLIAKPDYLTVLQQLAASPLLWDRRIAMIATFAFLWQGRPEPTLLIADQLLDDQHDLIQKATGWMLRELGKRVDQTLLADYLEKHAATMPRTTLRYAIERFPQDRRQYYLQLKMQTAARKI